MSDVKYWVWLNKLPGLGARKFKILIKKFGTPEAVWNAQVKEFEEFKLWGKVYNNLFNKDYKDCLDSNMEELKKFGIKVYRDIDKEYPFLLKNIYDNPPIIYVKGDINVLKNKAISIIGTRRPTYYGQQVAKKIATGLSQRGYTIVSGMARGIDTLAHTGAIEAKGKTVAVLGSGIDVIYPPENKKVAQNIFLNGAIISEFPLGTQPIANHFPMRNRIISGVSKGVVVIEATEKSGTLITVDYALEQGREVFAVPGCINSAFSYGCNKLIKDGAKIVTKLEDIIEEFEGIMQMNLNLDGLVKKSNIENLTENEKRIINFIGNSQIQIEDIQINTKIDIQELNSVITLLEIKGLIKRLEGNFYVTKV